MLRASVLVSSAVVGVGGQAVEYCPLADDLGWDYQDESRAQQHIHDQGWSITGGARVHSKTAFNLLGGSVEFDYDATGGIVGQNNNLYTISPDLGGKAYTSMDQYCDGQKQGSEWCMELDIIEANGNCGGATTLHTVGGNQWPKCDGGGCQATYMFNGKTTMHVRADWDTSGTMTTVVDGKTYGYAQMDRPVPSETSGIVADIMKRRGALIQSSQWTGWCPLQDQCHGGGALSDASFSVKNLRIKGAVVSGPEPNKCNGSSPSPTPSPTPTPPPTPPSPPVPSHGTCHWQSCSNNVMDGWCSESQSQCQSCGGGTWCTSGFKVDSTIAGTDTEVVV